MYYGRATIQVEKVLSLGRPRTAAEISLLTGISTDTISASLSRMVQRGEAHISCWHREVPGKRAYLRAAYKLGKGENAAKPEKLTMSEIARRYRRKPKVKTQWQFTSLQQSELHSPS